MGVDNVSSQETNSSISRKVPRHQVTIKKKHVAEITSRLESSKREIAIQRKSERAWMLIMNLTRAKLAEDQKQLQSLERRNAEMSSLMKQRTEELDVMSAKLEALAKKINEASTTLDIDETL
jgi:hypothetical protein